MNGVVTVLGTVSFTVRPNTWYDLRLDALGNELRGFINGAQVLQAIDSSHTSVRGRGAVYLGLAAPLAGILLSDAASLWRRDQTIRARTGGLPSRTCAATAP